MTMSTQKPSRCVSTGAALRCATLLFAALLVLVFAAPAGAADRVVVRPRPIFTAQAMVPAHMAVKGEDGCGLTTDDVCYDADYQACPGEGISSYAWCIRNSIEFFYYLPMTYWANYQVPDGIQLDDVVPIDVNGENHMWGCANEDGYDYWYELHFSTTSPTPSEGHFVLPVAISGYAQLATGGYTADYTLYHVFEGEILIKDRKIVVVVDPPQEVDPQFESTICFFEEGSRYRNSSYANQTCEEKRTLYQPAVGLDMDVSLDTEGDVDPETVTEFDVKIYKENSRDLRVNTLFVAPPGKLRGNSGPYSIQIGTMTYYVMPDGGIPVDFALEKFGSSASALAFRLQFGANINFIYTPGQHNENLFLTFDSNCADGPDESLRLYGEVKDPPQLKFERVFDGWDKDITGRIEDLEEVYPSATEEITIRISYLNQEGSYQGTLKLVNKTDHGPGFDYSFEADSDVTEFDFDVAPGEPELVTVHLRTGEEVDEQYRARFKVTGVVDPAFILRTTTLPPFEVKWAAIPGQAHLWDVVIANDGVHEVDHMADPDNGAPLQPDHDYFTVVNVSDATTVEVSDIGLRVTSAGSADLGGEWTSGLRVLGPGQRADFRIDTYELSCSDPLSAELTFDYRIGSAVDAEPFAFTYKTNPCFDPFMGFDPPPPPPPSAPSMGSQAFYLTAPPNGLRSVTGTFNLSLDSVPAHDDLLLDVELSGSSAFSANATQVVVTQAGGEQVNVKFRPSDYERHAATITFDDPDTGNSWSYDLDGMSCGGHGVEACSGTTCAPDLQQCAAGLDGYQRCYHCCGDGERNGICGIRANGQPCSWDPAAGSYFDADCCGGWSLEACPDGCLPGLQECGDGKCWYCCGDGTTNGTCGTYSDGGPCSGIPGTGRYDADCDCGGLNELACVDGCLPGLQQCANGRCRRCCGDGAHNGICGTTAGGVSCSGIPGSATFDADCDCGGHSEPACPDGCVGGLQECADGRCWYCCGDGSTNGICGTYSDGGSCSGVPGTPRYDEDCDCGGHGEPACVDGCRSNLQQCADGKCWYCCDDGSSNGVCGTWWDGTSCSAIPGSSHFDIDCDCGGHGEPACSDGCLSGFQQCADGKCWYCCGDGSTNGICGTYSDGDSCSALPGSSRYDADCDCGGHGEPACPDGCLSGYQECGDGLCWNCCGDGTLNGICGTAWDGTSCSSNPSSNKYDADCSQASS